MSFLVAWLSRLFGLCKHEPSCLSCLLLLLFKQGSFIMLPYPHPQSFLVFKALKALFLSVGLSNHLCPFHSNLILVPTIAIVTRTGLLLINHKLLIIKNCLRHSGLSILFRWNQTEFWQNHKVTNREGQQNENLQIDTSGTLGAYELSRMLLKQTSRGCSSHLAWGD